jgi:hypothetical protein
MGDDPHVQRIIDSARVSLPGATDGTMRLELFNVVEEFCRETNAWQDVSCLTLCPQQCEYPIYSTDGNGEIYRLLGVENACPTDPKFTARSWMPIPGVLRVDFVPSAPQDLHVVTALSPSELGRNQQFPGVPDWFISQYAPTLTAGLAGKMMAQPAKPYSSPQLATSNLGKYRRGIAQTRMFLQHGNLQEGARWNFPQSFAVRRRKY